MKKEEEFDDDDDDEEEVSYREAGGDVSHDKEHVYHVHRHN